MAKFPGAIQYPVRWWGYPNVHSARRIKPSILLVIHITGNSNLPSAMGEAQYSNRDGSGASFTFVTNRDGTIVQCLDPETQTPWTNGDLNKPNTSIPTVAQMVGSPYNANEFCYATCENVGYEPNGHPITAEQKKTLAQLVAWAHEQTGLPINRSTVIGHRDINNVTRHNCPTSGDLEKFLGDIIAAAKAIVSGGTAQEEDPAVIAELQAKVEDQAKLITWLKARRDFFKKAVADAEEQIAQLEAQIEELAPFEAANSDLRKRIQHLRTRLSAVKAIMASAAEDAAKV